MARARFITYAADGTGVRDGRCRADQVEAQLLDGEAGVFALPQPALAEAGGFEVLNEHDLAGIREALASQLDDGARAPVLAAASVGAAHAAYLEALE